MLSENKKAGEKVETKLQSIKTIVNNNKETEELIEEVQRCLLTGVDVKTMIKALKILSRA